MSQKVQNYAYIPYDTLTVRGKIVLGVAIRFDGELMRVGACDACRKPGTPFTFKKFETEEDRAEWLFQNNTAAEIEKRRSSFERRKEPEQ